MSKRHRMRRDALRLALGVALAAEQGRPPSPATVRRAEAVLEREGIQRASGGWAATVRQLTERQGGRNHGNGIGQGAPAAG